MSALIKKILIYLITHDSIGLGEDGPTHQPIEQLSGLRSIPNLNVFRPADRVETIECWEHALKEPKSLATRKCSEMTLSALTKQNNTLIGGSADLAGSNNTKTKNHKIIKPGDFSGDYIHFGVREHAMSGIMNGIALHSNFIPYGGTFLIFSDYCKPSIRLSALMKKRVIYVMTHDSIGLGEDGPTHQPIEQLSGLRSIPNLNVFRPADRVETIECWEHALKLSLIHI